MQIKNKTHWRTDQLKAFASKVAAVELDAGQRKKLTIECVHSRSRGISGCAWRRASLIRIRIPRQLERVNKPALAMVLAHEMAHVRGLPGGRSSELAMRSSDVYGYRGKYKEHYAWANELPLEQKPPKLKPKIDAATRARDKRERIEQLIRQWETKRKRAETAIKKYRRHLRYYDKRLAAMDADA